MKRAVINILFALLVLAAEKFIESTKKSKGHVGEKLCGPARGLGLYTTAAMKGGFAMNGQYQQQGVGIGWIILLVILYIIINPIPGPIDDVAVAAIGGYQALKRL